MSVWISVLLMTAVSGTEAVDTASDSSPRAYHQISKDLRDIMKRESLAKSDADRIAAVKDLAALYLELKHDPRLDETVVIRQYKSKAWSRLLKIKKDLQREIARNKKKAKRSASPEISLAEQQALEQANQDSEIIAAQMTLVSYSLGGPGKVFAESGGSQGGFGGAAIRDNAEELIELITRVIEPDFWDVNGGPGSVFYYAPLQALVVRATSEVHFKLGGGIKGLRGAP